MSDYRTEDASTDDELAQLSQACRDGIDIAHYQQGYRDGIAYVIQMLERFTCATNTALDGEQKS